MENEIENTLQAMKEEVEKSLVTENGTICVSGPNGYHIKIHRYHLDSKKGVMVTATLYKEDSIIIKDNFSLSSHNSRKKFLQSVDEGNLKELQNILINQELLLEETIKKENLEKMKLKASKANESEDAIGRSISANDVVAMFEQQDTELFHDDGKDAYARVPINGHYKILKVAGRDFKRYISKLVYDGCGDVLSSETFNRCVSLLEAKACFDGKEYSLKVRVASHDGNLWYDLSDDQRNAIKITPKGWEVKSDTPILFKQYTHQKAQVMPKNGGNIFALDPFLNIKCQKQRCLLYVALVTSFIADIDHPIFVFFGEKGATKTTIMEQLRAIIDPSAIQLLSFPKDQAELIQIMSHHWCPFFDNVTYLSTVMSDIMCRAATGGAFSKRVLYTVDDDAVCSFRRVQAINGINLVATKPDLLDRSLLFELERVKKKDRRPKKEFVEEFQKVLPEILGGVFDALSKAMKIYKGVSLKELPRMADFTKWGVAVAEALGLSQEEFLDAYNDNLSIQNKQVIQANPVALAIVTLSEKHLLWEGTASELLGILKEIADSENIITQHRAWPKAPNSLSRRIREMLSNLEEEGIFVDLGDSNRTASKRLITISRKASQSSDRPEMKQAPEGDGTDATDDI